MALDVDAIRAQIPALKSGSARFDAPGGTQTPQARHRRHRRGAGQPAGQPGPDDLRASATRTASSRTPGARWPTCWAPSRGASSSAAAPHKLAHDLSRTLAKTWGPGDAVVVTRLDHDSNIRALDAGGRGGRREACWADFDPATGELLPEHIEAVLSPAHPAGRGDGRVQPHRHHARPAGRRPRRLVHGASARCSTSTRCTTPRTPSSIRRRSARTRWCARRTVPGPAPGGAGGPARVP